MSNVTLLAEVQITAFTMISVELVEANETPAVVVITWPGKATTLHPRLFPDVAAQIARAFAQAATELASIRARRRL
jgi:hypothetical protein